MSEQKAPDRNVEAVVSALRERSARGLAKYGVTTERGDLTLVQWLQHLQEELLDAAIYVERVKGLVELIASPLGRLSGEEMQRQNYLQLPISDLGLSVRAKMCLEEAGVKTVGELVQCNESKLLGIRSFGRTCLREVNTHLELLGLKLGNRSQPRCSHCFGAGVVVVDAIHHTCPQCFGSGVRR